MAFLFSYQTWLLISGICFLIDFICFAICAWVFIKDGL